MPDLVRWALFDVNYAFLMKWPDALAFVKLIRENSSRYDTAYFGYNFMLGDIHKDAPRSYVSRGTFDDNWPESDTPFTSAEVSQLPVSTLWRNAFRFYYSGAAYWGGNVGWQMPHGTEFLPGDYLFASMHTNKRLEEESVAWINSFGLTVIVVSEDKLASMLAEGFQQEISEERCLRAYPQKKR